MNPPELDHIDPDLIAQWLEGTGQYKVVRRIAQVTDFGGHIEHPVRVLIVDTETTGLELSQAELIEVGAILVEVDRDSGQLGKVLGQFAGLEQPSKPIAAESTAIHGITDEMVKDQRFDESAFQALCDGVDLFVAHNAAFDRPFMQRRFPWLEPTVWACSFRELPWKQEGYSGQKLEYLLSDCGYFHSAHRAVEDCNALLHVLSKPLKSSKNMPMAVLFESANAAMYQIAALKAPFEKKDMLRARGFRWNSEDRVWEFDAFGFSEGKEVIDWLKSEVYGTTSKVMLGFRTRSGSDRYAGNEVRQQYKEV